MSIERASDCHVQNTWIDATHRQSQLYNDMHQKTQFNYCINSDRFDMALAPRFSNGDVAQMVERTLTLQEVRGSMPRISNFSEEPGNQKKEQRETFFQTKRSLICASNMRRSASATEQSLLRKRLLPQIPKVYLRKTSKETLL